MYLTGPFGPAGNFTLRLEAGAPLKSSEDPADYALTRGRGRLPLTLVADAEDIAVGGRGIGEGSGTVFTDMTKTGTASR